MSFTVEELRSLPVDKLIELHDSVATHTSVGVSYYLEEIARRDSQTVLAAVAANTAEVKSRVEEFAQLTKQSGDRMSD
jgi:hypothetical protein